MKVRRRHEKEGVNCIHRLRGSHRRVRLRRGGGRKRKHCRPRRGEAGFHAVSRRRRHTPFQRQHLARGVRPRQGLLRGGGAAAEEHVGPGADDLWLWWRTRSALAASEDVRDLTINVDVDNGVVTLSGTVRSAEQRGRAEQAARGVGGVRDVKNNLSVGRL
ncbi:MAG: BON domain-containing protein [Acidobacteria bacterium]|nr:BON domain-containing protein [Acidobacteriota bacterium]MCA1618634.1 BON domain-containing protein [Acidobacteriota bacterium]